jgi:hypothetical protein
MDAEVKATPKAGQDNAFRLEFKAVAPFPKERFLRWIDHLKVQSKDFGLVDFRLLGSQRYLLEQMCEALDQGITTFVILKARQLGISSFFLALDMFWAFQHKGLLGVFITHKEEARDDFRATVEVFFAETPKGFKISYARHNRNLLILKNSSRFRYLIAGTAELKKGGLGRGGATNFVHATECAFYGDGDGLAEFRSQTSSLYPHRLYVYETTANGFNHFWDMWEGSKHDPTKKCVFIGWWRDERNQLPVDHPFFSHYMPDGIRTALSPLERRRVRLVREQYNFQISLQQVAWYRWHLASEKDGDQSMMDQEYPWTEEDAFQATGSKFFTVESMSECLRAAKRLPFKPYRYRLTHKFEETTVQQVNDPRAEFRMWEDANRHGFYVLGCDPAYGTSDEADRSVISIWRAYADCMVQVAEYCSTSPSTYQCAWVLAHLAGYYGVNYLMPIMEINGPGQAVFDELEKVRKMASEIRPHDANYNIRNILQNMRHYFYRRMDNPGGGEMLYQWKTTEDLKRRAMNMYKNGIELGRAVPRSVQLLEEMRRIINDAGWIGAEGNAKDDRVMAAALAYQAWNQWVQPKVKALGLTQARSNEIERQGGTPPIDRVITSYLKRMKIEMPAKEATS